MVTIWAEVLHSVIPQAVRRSPPPRSDRL